MKRGCPPKPWRRLGNGDDGFEKSLQINIGEIEMKPLPSVDHDIHELILKRWSPRAFAPRPVEEEKLMSLFEAMRWAASSMNEQPWRIIYAVKEDAERYATMLDCLVEGNRIWANTAPVLVLTMVKTHFARNGQPNRWAFHDLGLAIGNLSIQAAALDIYVHNMGGFAAEKARVAFRIPDDLEPVTMIAIGYLGDTEILPESLKARELLARERKPLEELIIGGLFFGGAMHAIG
jgi:nitroreductase